MATGIASRGTPVPKVEAFVGGKLGIGPMGSFIDLKPEFSGSELSPAAHFLRGL